MFHVWVILYDICLSLVWLTSFKMIISRSIHDDTKAWFHSFYGWVIFQCVYTHTHAHTHYIFFIHSSVDGHLGYFHVLAIVNAAVTLVEKEMAPHSSVLVWRIPWTEKPGGLQSMGLHRVRDDWSDLAAAAAAAAVTLGYMYLFQLWFYQGICPVVGLLSHMVVLFLVF